MKKIRILFVCKYNRFRSRIAEAYFKKINKNKKYIAESAGVIQGFLPLDKNEVKAAKDFGISILGKPRAMTMDLLKKQDIIVVVANDVPKEIFSYKWYKDKVRIMKIKDVKDNDKLENIRKVIKTIIKNLDKFTKQLKW